MAQPTFYTYPLAYSPFKVLLAAAETGYKVETRNVDLFNGDSLRPDFLSVNRSGAVPVLVDGDKTIAGSRAIAEHINTVAGPLGGNEVNDALVKSWIDRVDRWDGNLYAAGNASGSGARVFALLGEFRERFAAARLQENPDLKAVYEDKIAAMRQAGADAQDASKVAANKKQLVTLLDDADKQLQSTKFIAGDSYTLADAVFTPVVFRVKFVGQAKELIEPRAAVSRYFREVQQRPSYAVAFDGAKSAGSWILPAVAKAAVCKLTGWY